MMVICEAVYMMGMLDAMSAELNEMRKRHATIAPTTGTADYKVDPVVRTIGKENAKP